MRSYVSAIAMVMGLFGTAVPVYAQHGGGDNGCYYDMTCLGCQKSGRAYTNISGNCTVCWAKFCYPRMTPIDPISLEHMKSAEKVAAADPGDQPVNFSIPASVIRSLACTNPEVADTLLVLNWRSKQKPSLIPAKGDGSSRGLTNCNSVLQKANEGVDLKTAVSERQALGAGKYSRVSWELIKTPQGGRLVLQHRVLNTNGEEVDKPYADISLELQKAGESQWNALRWELNR